MVAPHGNHAACGGLCGRGARTRTADLLVPNQARYRLRYTPYRRVPREAGRGRPCAATSGTPTPTLYHPSARQALSSRGHRDLSRRGLPAVRRTRFLLARSPTLRAHPLQMPWVVENPTASRLETWRVRSSPRIGTPGSGRYQRSSLTAPHQAHCSTGNHRLTTASRGPSIVATPSAGLPPQGEPRPSPARRRHGRISNLRARPPCGRRGRRPVRLRRAAWCRWVPRCPAAR
jgi:hypothetical protein